LLDYRALGPVDMPPVSSILIESDDPIGPYGAKGVGEMATIGTPDAFVSAVYDAVGVWVTDLPATPEKIFMSLRSKRKKR
jgi:CO/xanthine dehydrogenase Mo-binding subunit